MHYFKHSELAAKYHVSLKTVHNWIDAARQGKVNLTLCEHGTRTYIANVPANEAALEHLAEQGKKYRNARYRKVVTPKPAFYEIYSRRQILDIISNLKIHGEIPRQYNYLDGGAVNWDNWLKRLAEEDTPNILNSTIELIHNNLGVIDNLIQSHRRVNVIDIGAGNAQPVRELLGHLLKQDKLSRYIAIDISPTMLEIAERNVRQWFDGKVRFEGHIRDITHERFDDLVVDDMLQDDADQVINVVLLLGATPLNMRNYTDVLRAIHSSMGMQDILVYTDKSDTEASRSYFDFHPKPGSNKLSPNHRFILDLMNIDESLYEVDMGFDPHKRMRYVRIKLTVALTVNFKFEQGERSVELEKGDTILLLRVWHMTALEIIAAYEKLGFLMLHSSMTRGLQYLLTISAVDARSELGSPARELRWPYGRAG